MNKHLKYLSYIIRHKWFVFQAGLKTRAPLWNLLIHDWSKFLPSEWFPYVEYFYGGGSDECIAKGKFDEAWNHHQKRNKHHWQYWLLQRDDGSIEAIGMPHKYIREMVADWAGAGRAITGKWEVKTWYRENRHKMVLDPSTDYWVEGFIELFPEPKEEAALRD